MYTFVSQPSSGSSKSLVSSTASSLLWRSTCCGQSAALIVFSAASYKASQLSRVMCSSVNPKNVCAMSTSQLY